MTNHYHLYVALSGHGFGHLAQMGPVLNEWRRRWPEARLTVQSALPAEVLRQRIRGEFAVAPGAADFGMIMADALTVQVAESLAAYRAFHAHWDERLAWQERLLREAAPDVLLADVPYLTLAAAARLKIPALALCSLNWADILPAIARMRRIWRNCAHRCWLLTAAPSPFYAQPRRCRCWNWITPGPLARLPGSVRTGDWISIAGLGCRKTRP
jgi:hypothetical protein